MANRLADQTSPYLLQHAHNPVDWYPWGDEAFARARAENKLVLVSIGYSACHWCHVMERESFEDADIAAVMNEHFVCIKVDREERPDVDSIYMDAVQIMRGTGGWPLNCFTLPDGRPIYGGTYFPKAQWFRILNDLAAYWQREPAKAEEYANNLTEAVRSLEERGAVPPGPAPEFTTAHLLKLFAYYDQRIDREWGGLQGAPKFPVPANWHWMLRYAWHSASPDALAHLRLTLDRMADGGLYDPVGGGFARYSVDAYWRVPHFEKMLYDNGQLLQLYADAYRLTGEPRYCEVVARTAQWIAREMTGPEGGFYSALDADSEGVEGKFYLWTQAELEALLGDRAPLFKAVYNIVPEGNWEHGANILFRTEDPAVLASRLGLTPAQLAEELHVGHDILLRARESRIRPGLDDKLLTGWNALAVIGLVAAWQATDDRQWLDLALRNARFIEENLADGARLHRTWKQGKATLNAYLEDYALNIQALVALYHATFDTAFLTLAARRAEYVLAHFSDGETGLFYFTSNEDAPLLARKKELNDSVIPASNSVMAHQLLTLGILLDRPEWRERAHHMLVRMLPQLERYPQAHGNWGLLLMRFVYPDQEVAVCGPAAAQYAAQLRRQFRPDALLMGFEGSEAPAGSPVLLSGKGKPGQTLVYVCRQQHCLAPVSEMAQVLQLLAAR